MTLGKIVHHNTHIWGESYNVVMHDGYVLGNLQIDNEEPKAGCIYNISVHESARELGYGSEMLNYLESLAKTLNLSEVYLTVEKHSWAYYWYRRSGYEEDEVRNYNEYPFYIILHKILKQTKI